MSVKTYFFKYYNSICIALFTTKSFTRNTSLLFKNLHIFFGIYSNPLGAKKLNHKYNEICINTYEKRC